MPATLGRQTRHRTDALDEHAVRHVSKFDWAYLRLFCWPCRSISGSRMPRQDCPDTGKFTIRGDGAGGSGQEDTHRSGFWDGGCYFVAVTAWMMAAYRGATAVSAIPLPSPDGLPALWCVPCPAVRPAGSAAAAPRTGRPGPGSRRVPAPGRTAPALPAGPPSDQRRG